MTNTSYTPTHLQDTTDKTANFMLKNSDWKPNTFTSFQNARIH